MVYTAFITRIANVQKHPDPEVIRLKVGECFGNQVVVGIDTMENDIGLYFPADGRLSDEYLKANNLVRNVVDGKNIGGLFDANGKVRTQKIRKAKSDGYFCSIESLAYTGVDLKTLVPGIAFTEINGHKICEKFVNARTMTARGEKKKVVEKIKYPFFFEHIDTEQLAYKMNEVKEGMFLVFTEKLHGTSQRTAFTIEEKPLWYGKLINGLFKRVVIQPRRDYNYVCGTRRVVLKDFDNNRGFYGDNEKFREFAHKEFVGKLQKGETVYYEVVGYAAEKTPLMPVANNAKLQDKEFVKKYGKETCFKYGCMPGQHEVYVYRITMTNEDGTVVDLSWDDVKRRCRQMDVKHVPELFRLVYIKPNENKDFFEFCDKFAEGDSTIDPEHIREGIVVRADGSTWTAWKYKSFQFKVLEDIIKLQNDTVDIEEAQDV
jgi:hypothetical protein